MPNQTTAAGAQPPKVAVTTQSLSSEHLQSVLDSIRDVIYSVTPDGEQILYVSPSASKVYEMNLDEFTGSPKVWFNRIHEEDRERAE